MRLPSLVLFALTELSAIAVAQKYLYSFGSSYTATGFDASGQQPSPEQPLGNPAYGDLKAIAGGGPNYIDYLVTRYNTSLVLSYNYAVGGTVVDTTIVNGASPDLGHQIQILFEHARYNDRFLGSAANELFLIFMGDNDVQGSYRTGTPVEKLMGAYFDDVEKLYGHGARNFLFVTVPQLDKAPSHNLTHDTKEQNQELVNVIEAYNTGIHTHAETFQQGHQDAKVEIYEFNVFMGKVLAAPRQYGFDDATCEGDGPDAQCIWWKPSDGHTTSRFQNEVAQDMQSVMKNFGW